MGVLESLDCQYGSSSTSDETKSASSPISPKLRRGHKAPGMCSLPPGFHATIVGTEGSIQTPAARCIMPFTGNRNARLTIGCLILGLMLGLVGCGPAAPAGGGSSAA